MTSLLEVSSLTKQFGSHVAVDHVSFSIEEHTITALIGPNGAGKTTVLSMLTGLLTPTAGQIQTLYTKGRDIRSIIGFLPQYPQYYSWLTALEYTEMMASLSGVPKREARLAAQKMLEYVGLGQVMHKKTATFSGGMKQRLGIAQALVHKPKLLLLDEPVSALDPAGRREILNLLMDIREQTTILYSTHILNDAEEMTDQLLFLKKGQLVEQGSLEDVRKRYEEPGYRIQFHTEAEAQQFVAQSNGQAVVKGATVLLEVNSGLPTMAQVLQLLATSPYEVQRVERQTASLEEIFMKVAGDK